MEEPEDSTDARAAMIRQAQIKHVMGSRASLAQYDTVDRSEADTGSSALQRRKSIGRRIAERRKQLRMTQRDLSDSWGYTRERIAGIETGRAEVDAGDLPRLATVLDVPLIYFFGGEEIEAQRYADSSRAVKLMTIYRGLPETVQMLILGIVEQMAGDVEAVETRRVAAAQGRGYPCRQPSEANPPD